MTALLLALAAGAQQQLQGDLDAVGSAHTPVTFEGDAVELPIELAGALVLVDGVHVNGQGPFRFMLDTGAQGIGRIDSSLAAKLELTPEGQARGNDGTDRPGRAMDMYRLDSLSLGGLRAEGGLVLSRDYNEHGAALRGHIDGILGIGLFDDVLLTIDYPNQVLRIERGELAEADGREVLELAPERDIPTVMVELAGTTHAAYLDSGAMGPLALPGELETSLPLVGEPHVVGQARTVTGTFDLRAATLDGTLSVGRHDMFQPSVVFGGPLRDVILSSEVLSDYALTLDRAHGRVRFWRGGYPAHESAPARTVMTATEQRVPLTQVLGRPVIEAHIDGKGPFRFLLDTGAATTVLNADLVREMGLPSTGATTLGTPGNDQSSPALLHVLSQVTVGDATFHDVPAHSWDHPIMAALGDVQGVLGLPLFHDLVVTLDLPAGELALTHGSLGADAIEYTIDESGLPAFQIDVAGQTIPAHLDTGNPSTLAIPASYVPMLPLAYEPRVIGRGQTASGVFEIRGAPLEGNANIVGILLEKPLLHIQEWNEYANIGGRVLAGRALRFDQRNRRFMAGELAAPGETAIAPKTSGQRRSYGVMPAITPTGPIELRGVVPNSLAEEAGLQTGDSIVALNGVDVDELDMEARVAAFRGSKLKLTVEREGKRLEFELAHE